MRFYMTNHPWELNIEHCFVAFTEKIDAMNKILVGIHIADILPFLYILKK